MHHRPPFEDVATSAFGPFDPISSGVINSLVKKKFPSEKWQSPHIPLAAFAHTTSKLSYGITKIKTGNIHFCDWNGWKKSDKGARPNTPKKATPAGPNTRRSFDKGVRCTRRGSVTEAGVRLVSDVTPVWGCPRPSFCVAPDPHHQHTSLPSNSSRKTMHRGASRTHR